MTKDSETLGFSHLGTPNLHLVRFLCTIGCSFPALGSFDGIECSCRVPQHCCKIPNPHRKDTSAMPNYILWVYAGNSNYDGILWCVIWHVSSLKVWVEGPTVTKDSETLGFSHLGTPCESPLVRFTKDRRYAQCKFTNLGASNESGTTGAHWWMAASLCSGSDQVLTPQKGDGSEAGGVICCSICGKMINSQSQIFMASKFFFWSSARESTVCNQ